MQGRIDTDGRIETEDWSEYAQVVFKEVLGTAMLKLMKAPVPWGRVFALKLVMSNSVGTGASRSLTGAALAPRRRAETNAKVFILASLVVFLVR